MSLLAEQYPDIGTLLPHAGQMVLLDRLIDVDDDSVCAEVTIRSDSVFFSQCGDGAGVGAWVGIEYMAQAIAAHGGHAALLRGAPVKVGFLLGARRYQALQPSFLVGSVLHVHARRVLQGDNGLIAFDCRIDIVDPIAARSAAVASATVTVFVPAQAGAGSAANLMGSGNESI
jgi:3-oxoacyl-[acyl-carrier-protein] synthase-1